MNLWARSILFLCLWLGAVGLVLAEGWEWGKEGWTAEPVPTHDSPPTTHRRQTGDAPPVASEPPTTVHDAADQRSGHTKTTGSTQRPTTEAREHLRSLADRGLNLWNDTYERISELVNSPTARTQAARGQEAVGCAWETCRDYVTRILALDEEKRQLPEKAILRRDRGDVDKRIQRLLDDVVAALEISGLSDCRKRYVALDSEIRKAECRIVEYEEKKISAPANPSRLNPFSISRSQYENRINEQRKKIHEHLKQQHELVTEMHSEYKRIGIDITREHVEFYLSAASGKDIVGLSAVFHNVKELNRLLEKLMQQEGSAAEAQRRYYGVHVVLVHALVHAHDVMIQRIDENYVPRLAAIAKENRRVNERTRALIAQGGAHIGILQANLRAQQSTTEAVHIYENHLEGLKARVQKSRLGVQDRYLVAKNTYDTILVASALVEEMEACVRDLMALRDMHLPDLLSLDDRAVQEKFVEISALLASE